MRTLVHWLAVVIALSTVAAARAQEWPRFHVGVAIGQPHWRADLAEAGVPLPEPILAGNRVAEPDTGWKFVAGFRPLRVFGVELQLVNFGEEDAGVYGGFQYGGQIRGVWQLESEMRPRPQATVLSAVLFIPEALPRLDVYGKVGVGDLKESISASAIRRSEIECPPPGARLGDRGTGPCAFTGEIEDSESAPYLGIGARFSKGRSWGVRFEYDWMDSDVWNDTTMLSVGVAWER